MKALLVGLLLTSTVFVRPNVSSGEAKVRPVFSRCNLQQGQKRQKQQGKKEQRPAPKPTPAPTPALPEGPKQYLNPPANSDDPGGPSAEMSYSKLTGTYRLNTSRSDDARKVAASATRSLPDNARLSIYKQLIGHLESPMLLAIEEQGRRVTLASSRDDKVTVEADWRDRAERASSGGGQIVLMGAKHRGEQFVVTSGDGRSVRSSVSYCLIDNGRRLRVTRSVRAERLDRQIKVESIYDRISEVAQWDVSTSGNEYARRQGETLGSIFIVPYGTRLVAVLDNTISTSGAREGEQFTMTVREPEQYQGARIKGHISHVDRSAHPDGRSSITFNLDRIHLQGGPSYRFSAVILSVQTPQGERFRVAVESDVTSRDQDKSIPARDSGNTSGSIIGAIIGGGKGAAIGTASSTNAGSVYAPGRDGFELASGSEMTLQVISPR
jgi:hypothetical protein